MYDIAVIGAGPAGCTAAKRLSERGAHVLLLEKMKIPRYKSCSGVLIKKSMNLVREYFGKDVPESVMCTPTDNRGMIFTTDKGEEYRFEQEGLNVWRSSFDAWLAEQAAEAGAKLRDENAVLSCVEDENCVRLTVHGKDTYTEESRYVIDCEGVCGVVKRKLTGEIRNYITTYQTFNRGNIELDPHYFYAYLQPELSGYDAWFNVKDDMLLLGVSAKKADDIQGYYKKFTEFMKQNHGLRITEELKDDKWLMPQIVPGCPVNFGVGRILFAGECAGFLNPMGEGISAGMESGCAAADAVFNNFGNTEKIYDEYRSQTKALREYMLRQWSFVGNLSGTFAEHTCRANVQL